LTENSVAEERKRLKCEQCKERRDEMKTIIWINDTIASARYELVVVYDSALSCQPRRLAGAKAVV
jgi:hypothetical protein